MTGHWRPCGWYMSWCRTHSSCKAAASEYRSSEKSGFESAPPRHLGKVKNKVCQITSYLIEEKNNLAYNLQKPKPVHFVIELGYGRLVSRYKMLIRLVLSYGSECWTLTKNSKGVLNIFEKLEPYRIFFKWRTMNYTNCLKNYQQGL